MTRDRTCALCGKDLSMGMNVLQVREAAISPNGLARLQDIGLLFCREQCVSDYFSSGDDEQRIPEFT